MDFVRRARDLSFGIFAWFQDSWRDSRDSCLPNKDIRKLQSKNGKMLKFTDKLAICSYLFLKIPIIPRFLTRFVEIPIKAIDKIPNRVGPLCTVRHYSFMAEHYSIIQVYKNHTTELLNNQSDVFKCAILKDLEQQHRWPVGRTYSSEPRFKSLHAWVLIFRLFFFIYPSVGRIASRSACLVQDISTGIKETT